MPISSYTFRLITKKLPKKYPTFFFGLFTFSAEYLECRNVDNIGKVIFVILSIQRSRGITVSASRFSDCRCATANVITFFSNFVSASVNNMISPVAFLNPSIHAQFFPIHFSGFSLALTWMIFELSFANFAIISPVLSSEESSIAITSKSL